MNKIEAIRRLRENDKERDKRIDEIWIKSK